MRGSMRRREATPDSRLVRAAAEASRRPWSSPTTSTTWPPSGLNLLAAPFRCRPRRSIVYRVWRCDVTDMSLTILSRERLSNQTRDTDKPRSSARHCSPRPRGLGTARSPRASGARRRRSAAGCARLPAGPRRCAVALCAGRVRSTPSRRGARRPARLLPAPFRHSGPRPGRASCISGSAPDRGSWRSRSPAACCRACHATRQAYRYERNPDPRSDASAIKRQDAAPEIRKINAGLARRAS
jgi:hypothetical protein